MAKFKDCDPRWIVDERDDGTNVNNWHWTEKDCTAWSKARLTELLKGNTLLQTDIHTVQIIELRALTGEAFINNRKNKLFASYDFILKLAYSGEIKNVGESAAVNGTGTIEVPNLSDEQELDDLQFQIAPAEDSPHSRKLKDAIFTSGREHLRQLLAIYIQELKSGVPIKKDDTDDVSVESTPSTASKKTSGQMRPEEEPTSKRENGFHELQLTETYNAHPQDIYACFTVADKLQAFTQSPAKVDISIKNPETGLVVLHLRQIKIPEEDTYGHANVLSVTESGWKNQMFSRIKTIFGYGM